MTRLEKIQKQLQCIMLWGFSHAEFLDGYQWEHHI